MMNIKSRLELSKIQWTTVFLGVSIFCSLPTAAKADCSDRNDGYTWITPPSRPPSEGTTKGRHGANRVLYTPETARGGGVKATFSEPGFSLGEPWHRTKPSFYLGLQSGDKRVTMDAGVQWEKGEWDDAGTTRYGWWSFFMNVASQGCFSPWNPQPAYRVAQNELGATTLTLQVHPGDTGGKIDFTASGHSVVSMSQRPVYWTENDGRVDINGMKARRVVALTQEAGGPYYNNSNVSCSVSEGHMALISYQNTTSQSPILTWDVWKGPDHMDAKDYNPKNKARKGASVKERNEPWAVDFGEPFTRKRDDAGSHPTTAELASKGAKETDRYVAESVGIQLLKPKARVDRRNPPKKSGSG
jgi:hypothetical protein